MKTTMVQSLSKKVDYTLVDGLKDQMTKKADNDYI